MNENVGIIGTGMTDFGEHWERGLRDLGAEAGTKALKDAQIPGKEVEALYIGNMSAGKFVGQEHVAALTADQCGLNPVAASRVEAACASGSAAFRNAYLSIKSGEYDVAVAGGAEKMTDLTNEQVTSTLVGAGDEETEGFMGLTFPGLFALMAKRYMHKYGLTREELSKIPVKNHKFGKNNPHAQYQNEISPELVKKSPKVADPLRLFDCAPISDGAAAVVIASEEFIRENGFDPVWVKSSTQASDTLALHDRNSITQMESVIEASRSAYKEAEVSPQDIDVAELHDCFSIAEVIAYESLGFVEEGKAREFIRNGENDIGGSIPSNTDGGLKVGHPVGATGIKQIIEIINQLRGKAYNQVPDAEVGLTQNIGGSGATALIHILSR